jgi:hypothetical protein
MFCDAVTNTVVASTMRSILSRAKPKWFVSK